MDRDMEEEEGEGSREDAGQDEKDDRSESADNCAASSVYIKPNVPDPKCIVKQSLPKYTLTFQAQWYKKFPWLHVSPCVEGVLCFY